MRESRSALVAYYYFDFKDIAKRDIRGLLTSLLLQLVDNSDRCWDLLSRLHKRCGDGLEQPSDAALAHTAGILQYISIQFEILTNQEAPITGIHCKMPTVTTGAKTDHKIPSLVRNGTQKGVG